MTASALHSEIEPSATAAPSTLSVSTPRIRRATKLGRILTVMASGRSLNRYDAERIGDHCLHSTVAKIERYGILVARREETVPGYGGHATRVMRYRLSDDERKRAALLLGLRED